jgi:periplasmic divalent cation tolerance protein
MPPEAPPAWPVLDAASAPLDGEPVVVLVTAGKREDALAIAHALVRDRLAACVNVLDGVTSVYRWEGKVCEDPEALLVAKTRRALVPRLAARVKELHTYTCPETIALPLVAGAKAYLDWLAAETAPAPSGGA